MWACAACVVAAVGVASRRTAVVRPRSARCPRRSLRSPRRRCDPRRRSPPAVDPPIAWRHSVAVGKPFAGRLVRGVQLPAEGRDFFTYDWGTRLIPNRPWRRWGTDRLIHTLLDVLAAYRAAHPEAPRVGIADLSRPPRRAVSGENFGGLGHASHQNGLDADVLYPRVDGAEQRACGPRSSTTRSPRTSSTASSPPARGYVFTGPRLHLHGPRKVVVDARPPRRPHARAGEIAVRRACKGARDNNSPLMDRSTMVDLQDRLDELKELGLYRRMRMVSGPQGPRVVLDGKPVLLLCSDNALGLADHPRVREAAADAAMRWGVGAGASRLGSGNMTLHRRLEERLAAFSGTQSALLFGSGYLANVGVIPALAGKGDIVYADELNHPSLVDGCRLSGAEIVTYRHGDADHLAWALRQADGRGALIVTEGLFRSTATSRRSTRS